jgi:phosphoglycolate phosphatase-like HAD superfamily hydrolase
MIHCVVFDFDGTLVDSNQIKHDMFLEISARFENGLAVMSGILSAPEAGDRYDIFDRFVAKIRKDPGGCSQLSSELATSYSDSCHREIAVAPEIPGASDALKQLVSAGIRVFISSATPTEPLLKLIEARGLSRLVQGVFGGPSSKESHIKEIRRITSLDAGKILYVGDTDSDRKAAASAAVHFIGIKQCQDQMLDDSVHTIENLVGFFELIQTLNY